MKYISEFSEANLKFKCPEMANYLPIIATNQVCNGYNTTLAVKAGNPMLPLIQKYIKGKNVTSQKI